MSERVEVRPVCYRTTGGHMDFNDTFSEVRLDGSKVYGPVAHRDACLFAAELKARIASLPDPEGRVNVDTPPRFKVGDRVRHRGFGWSGAIDMVTFDASGDPEYSGKFDNGIGFHFCRSSIFEAAPEPPRRTVRLPAIGQRVKDEQDGRHGVVERLMIQPDDEWLLVKFDDMAYAYSVPAEKFTPVGVNPRWVEVVLPEEGK